MSANAWRTLLLSACALLFAVTVYATWAFISIMSTTGLRLTSTAHSLQYRAEVPADSPAYAAGLRDGDLIDAAAMAPAARYRLIGGDIDRINDRIGVDAEPISAKVHLTAKRGSRVIEAAIIPQRYAASWVMWISTVGQFWVLLFAAVIAWKLPGSREARVLCAWLLLSVCLNFAPNNWMTPFPALDAVLGAFGNLAWSAATPVLLASYAMLFARPPNPLRLVTAWGSYVCAALVALIWCAFPIALWCGYADILAPHILGHSHRVIETLTWLLPLLCAAFSLAQARGTERARLAWVTGSLGVLYVLEIWLNLTIVFGWPWGSELLLALNVGNFIAPLGLTYSLLNRRLLDIGFALNRAAVYTGVSIVIVGAFVLVEWGLSEWLSSIGHVANLAVSGAVALALGLSIRFVHARVDRVIDTVFFRKRHEDEQALRNFAHEAPYITDAAALISRTVAVTELRTGADFASIVLCGALGPIDENDPALVALRAWHKPLVLHGIDTALRGEIAYPMVARGQLVGALILGAKRSGEAYAPDESAALASIAHSVASALDVLQAKRAPDTAALDDIRNLCTKMLALLEVRA